MLLYGHCRPALGVQRLDEQSKGVWRRATALLLFGGGGLVVASRLVLPPKARVVTALLEVRPKREPEDGPELMSDFPISSSTPAERSRHAVVGTSLR